MHAMNADLFVAHEDDGDIRAEMFDLRGPPLLDVLERIGGVYAEAQEDDVSVWVGDVSHSVMILLASCAPHGEFNISVDFGDNVLKHSWGVHHGELLFGVHKQQRRLSTHVVTDDDKFLSTSFHWDEFHIVGHQGFLGN